METVRTNSLCLPFSRLSVIDTLGKGTFGSVQLVKEKTKGGVAALKTIPKESISKYMIEIQKQNENGNSNGEDKTLGSQALKEITAMKRVCTGKCSGIPRYVGDREDKDNYYILMDSVKGKSLKTIVNEIGPFTDINTIRSVLAQILSTISFIHSHNVLHRDLSDNNILIQPNGTVKIIDFGCATVFDPNEIPECSSFMEYPEVDPDDINKNNIIGTLDFIAPEVLVDGCFSEKSDIWSFGVLLFFMVTGHYPYSDDEIDDVYETMYNILENTVIYYETDEIYEPLYDLFCLCCNPDVYSRATIEDLKNHEFFSEIDWSVVTLPKSKRKPNLSVRTSILKNNANAALLANGNCNNGVMGPNQIYIASPTCLNSPIRINSPSCLYTPLSCGFNTPPIETNTESPIINTNSPVVNSPLVKQPNPHMDSPVRKSPLIRAANPVLSPKMRAANPILSPKMRAANPILSPKMRAANPILSPKMRAASPILSPKMRAANPILSPKLRASTPSPITVGASIEFTKDSLIFSSNPSRFSYPVNNNPKKTHPLSKQKQFL
jgi:serine/threonine protein kinase